MQDPERIESLEDLRVVKEEDVVVKKSSDEVVQVTITFTPTVPHCSLATLIGIVTVLYYTVLWVICLKMQQ